MSDSDSDWESDHDDDVAVVTSAPVSTPSVTGAAPAPPAAAAAPVGESSNVVPSVLVAHQVTLAMKDHPALAAGIPAGLTLLYDQAKNMITLFAYDPHKRPLMVEPFDGSKLPKPVLPFSLLLGDGEGDRLHQLQVTDHQARKWTAAFAAPQEAMRMMCNIAVATIVAKAAANTPMEQIYLKFDLSKGSGKTLKASQFASVQVRVWIVDLTTEVDARGTLAIGTVTGSNSWTTFNPDISVGGSAPVTSSTPITPPILNTTVSDVELASDDSTALSNNCPTTLCSALMSGGKLKAEGGARLIVVPGASELATEVLKESPLPRGGEGSVAIIQMIPISVSKKREKKEKKRIKFDQEDEIRLIPARSDEAQGADDDDESGVTSPSSAAASSSSSSSPSAESSSGSSAVTAPIPNTHFLDWSREVTSSVQPLLPALQTMSEQISAIPPTQQKIVKFLMTELYEGLVADLKLDDVLAAESSTDPAVVASVDPLQSAQLRSLQERVRGLVSGFVAKNQIATKGTLAMLVQTWKTSLLPIVQPLIQPEHGLLDEQRLANLSQQIARDTAAHAATRSSAAATSAASARANSGEVDKLKAQLSHLQSQHAAQLKKLEDANRTLQETVNAQKKALAALETKHTALVMAHVDMEESNTKLTSANTELQKKAQMCTVFESGLNDLRTMLEGEIEEKQKLQMAFNDLTQYQKQYKLTWLPDKQVTHCMKCQSKFSMFGGKSKGHCRYCGRVFCRDCCTESSIPEFGFASKVKICKPCQQFRAKMQGEKEEDDEDDESRKPSARGNGTGAGAGAASGGSAILSYDSDELE